MSEHLPAGAGPLEPRARVEDSECSPAPSAAGVVMRSDSLTLDRSVSTGTPASFQEGLASPLDDVPWTPTFGFQADDLGEKPETPPATGELLTQLGPLLPLSMLNALLVGLTMPVSSYLMMNVFASRRAGLPVADVHCEDSTQTPECLSAVLDLNDIATATAMVRPLLDITIAPALAVLSDSVGRRPVIVAFQFVQLVPTFGTCLAACGVLNPYAAIALSTIIGHHLMKGVSNSATFDRVCHPESRAAAMGLLEALTSITHIMGLALGFGLTFEMSYRIWWTSAIVMAFLYWLLLPESLAPQKRAPLVPRRLLPGFSMSILFRNTILVRLSLIIMFCCFVDSGFERVVTAVVQTRLDWGIQDSYILFLLMDMSVVLWLVFVFKAITERVGEIGALAVGRVAFLMFGVPLFTVQSKTQVMTLAAVFFGPATFATPAVSGLKSRMVSDSEQGAMQGALAAAMSLASSLGILFMGSTYSMASRSQDESSTSLIMTATYSAISLPILVLIFDLWREVRQRAALGYDPFKQGGASAMLLSRTAMEAERDVAGSFAT